MAVTDHRKVTSFSGNEIYCLNKLGYKPGIFCLGNNVLSLGVVRGIGAGLSNLAGGEVTEITKLVHDGRKNAYDRMVKEAKHYGGVGLAGISFDIINHGANLEFLAMGSTVLQDNQAQAQMSFSSFANAQQLYCQLDAGFVPKGFVFGNVAYSIGVGGNIKGALRGLKRGEVPQYTEIFTRTRHLALMRIKEEAKKVGANAVIGIQTSIVPLLGTQEMLMIGTASHHDSLAPYAADPITSDMTNEEMWNMVNIGYLPVGLVMGVSVYSLGLASGVASWAKSIAGGEVNTLTELLYEAREKAFERIQDDAKQYNADEVVGVKTRVYDLGGGLVEIMAIGTAVKKVEGVTTRTATLPPQAIIQDQDTFVEAQLPQDSVALNRKASAGRTQRGPIQFIISAIIIIFIIAAKIIAAMNVSHHSGY
jgi:uncharacterized protein YbjQ (UPF0145 family)